jgi:aryl-alcohol dehydrogenase-like predicted oxidoreductase
VPDREPAPWYRFGTRCNVLSVQIVHGRGHIGNYGRSETHRHLNPLGWGPKGRCFDPEARKANLAFVELLREMAARKSATPAQIALAWLLAQKPSIVPIPGTTKLHRLEENIAAAELKLTEDDLREIDRGLRQITPEGERLPQAAEAMTGG